MVTVTYFPLLILLAMAACTPAEKPTADVADPCGDPEGWVRNLYAPFATDGKTLPSEQLFDASTLALIKRDKELANGEVPWLDFDPICNCQDWQDLKVTSVNVTRQPEVRAEVVFENAGTKVREDYVLRCTAEGWRVHDIIVKPENASLRAGLEKATSAH